MQRNPIKTRIARLTSGAVAVGSAAVLLAAAVTTPAGAVTSPPYNTSVTVTTSALTVVTGQPVTYTAKVVSIGHGTPGGQVAFTITATNATTVACDGGNAISLSAGTAACVVSAGLLSTGGP